MLKEVAQSMTLFQYKEIRLLGNQPMEYNKDWSKIEKEVR